MPVQSRKLTRAETKRHNRRLVLKMIYDASEISRAEIARATGLTRTTASVAVGELMERGLVEEVGQGPSAGGKPPTLLQVVDDAHHLIGIDLSGIKLQGAVFDQRGRRLHTANLPLDNIDSRDTRDQVLAFIDQLVALTDRSLLGIGVGSPGLIDARHGVILQAVNLGWQDLALHDLLAKRYQVPIHLVSDSQAAALAEYTFANQAGVRDLALILMERGISAGLIINGQLFHGSGYSGASEIGHLRAVENGELCACGHTGCLETVANQQAVLRQAQAMLAKQPASALGRFTNGPEGIDLDAVLKAYAAGDQATSQLVNQLGRYLGLAVTNLVTVLNIPLVVLAGSVARFGDTLAQMVQAEMRQRSLARLAERTEVRISALGEESVMLGAAALVLSKELGVV
jgi:glucokinase-like ROK family protein